MKTIYHPADTRGVANHGWLNSHHTFSFASYFNPERMNFGALRVLNDDIIDPDTGFGTHPHNNMEIISIPLTGSLKHQDTMGNDFVIQKGEVQTMSAGTGIAHSEYNNSNEEQTNFLQIWVIPKEQNIKPDYSQKKFDADKRKNQFQLIVSPDGAEGSATINQDSYFSLIDLEANNEVQYKLKNKNHGVYLFLLSGGLEVGDQKMQSRDGVGIVEVEDFNLKATKNSEVLLMEVPMIGEL